jgi:hypothetical protein
MVFENLPSSFDLCCHSPNLLSTVIRNGVEAQIVALSKGV